MEGKRNVRERDPGSGRESSEEPEGLSDVAALPPDVEAALRRLPRLHAPAGPMAALRLDRILERASGREDLLLARAERELGPLVRALPPVATPDTFELPGVTGRHGRRPVLRLLLASLAAAAALVVAALAPEPARPGRALAGQTAALTGRPRIDPRELEIVAVSPAVARALAAERGEKGGS